MEKSTNLIGHRKGLGIAATPKRVGVGALVGCVPCLLVHCVCVCVCVWVVWVMVLCADALC